MLNKYPKDFYIGKISERQFSEIWSAAIKQAKRSTFTRFKTGAVIFDNKSGEICSSGCSHDRIDSLVSTNSVHAEIDASKKVYGPLCGKSILILTLNQSGRIARSSRPCYSCASLMARRELDYIYYPERLNDGSWILNKETADLLYNKGIESGATYSKYASKMRLG
jgi:deoxycytidylate deaminase